MGIFQTIAAVILALIVLLVWAMGGWHSPRVLTESFNPASASQPPKSFTVVSFNTSWFYGMGSEGPGYEPKDKKHFEDRLRTTADWLKFKHPDLVLLQEVDFKASRSHRMNELAELSRLSELPYQAQAVSWNVNYLPFPYTPVTAQWGKIVSGGGVLSKTPIVSQTVQLLKKPDSNFFLYNQFYLFRYLQIVDLGFGLAVNLHLEAFDEPNRKEHIEALKKFLSQNADRIWIIAGDFNTPELKGSDFLPLLWAKDSAKTFPTTGADIRLDHIWYNPSRLKLIHSETGTELKTSDHHPILSVFETI